MDPDKLSDDVRETIDRLVPLEERERFYRWVLEPLLQTHREIAPIFFASASSVAFAQNMREAQLLLTPEVICDESGSPDLSRLDRLDPDNSFHQSYLKLIFYDSARADFLRAYRTAPLSIELQRFVERVGDAMERPPAYTPMVWMAFLTAIMDRIDDGDAQHPTPPRSGCLTALSLYILSAASLAILWVALD